MRRCPFTIALKSSPDLGAIYFPYNIKWYDAKNSTRKGDTMGLTAKSSGLHAVYQGLYIQKEQEGDRVIALAGNPNVGKSTVFNALTGLNQHTGNWPGKTVTNAQGRHSHNGRGYVLVDLPGTYSLMAHSAEEEVARDFICFGCENATPDAVVVVCDATCLERNLNLVLQTLEITTKVVVCVNLMDEAKKKGIAIDLALLSCRLGVPVVGASARSGKGLTELMAQVESVILHPPELPLTPAYPADVEESILMAKRAIEALVAPPQQSQEAGAEQAPVRKFALPSRWIALKLLDGDNALRLSIQNLLELPELPDIPAALSGNDFDIEAFRDKVVFSLVHTAELLCSCTVFAQDRSYNRFDRRLDRVLTGKHTGVPIMLLFLSLIFWITITGANLPSQILSDALFWVQGQLTIFFHWMAAPEWLHGILVLGLYRVLAWVVSVMLPPMAIFFPLFTLLEDFGYLPRVAFNLDHHFKRANTCGKQALTMCMGSLSL